MPESVEERFRGDAAGYEQTLLKWLRDGKRENGPEGFIGFKAGEALDEVRPHPTRLRRSPWHNLAQRKKARRPLRNEGEGLVWRPQGDSNPRYRRERAMS